MKEQKWEQLHFKTSLRRDKSWRSFLKSTPLIHYPELSERLGCQAYIKHENHNPTGSFKVRGGPEFHASLTAGTT